MQPCSVKQVLKSWFLRSMENVVARVTSLKQKAMSLMLEFTMLGILPVTPLIKLCWIKLAMDKSSGLYLVRIFSPNSLYLLEFFWFKFLFVLFRFRKQFRPCDCRCHVSNATRIQYSVRSWCLEKSADWAISRRAKSHRNFFLNGQQSDPPNQSLGYGQSDSHLAGQIDKPVWLTAFFERLLCPGWPYAQRRRWGSN